LPIRTLVHREGEFDLGIGAGIVWDSDTSAEHEETLLKGSFSRRWGPEMCLLETLAVGASGELVFLEEHLERLERSAGQWNYACKRERIRQRLEEAVANAEQLPCVLRLTLSRTGEVEVGQREAPSEPPKPLRVLLVEERVRATSPWVRHKTTERTLYDQALAQASRAGCWEALLRNEEGALTEGAISNVFLRQADRWYTPPLSEGLLAGIWRQSFLEEMSAQEKRLTREDLRVAEEVVMGNSVRGGLSVDEVVDEDGEVLFVRSCSS
jgi:para-aminobenzoate synthetase/4-amino-4-deoxychorismate lyase